MARRTALATALQLTRLVLQLAFLILLARTLAPLQYGLFVGASSLATAAAGLSGLGTGMLLVKRVAVSATAWNAMWSHALRMFLGTGLVLAILFATSGANLLRVSITLPAMLCIGLSELICLPLVYLASFAFQAFDRIGLSAAMPCIMAMCRLLGIIAFSLSGLPRTLPSYVIVHVAASTLAAVLTLALVRWCLRPAPSSGRVPAGTNKEALRFCAGWFTNNALVELDKSLAVRFGSPTVAAGYALAYRLSSALSTPITSLVLTAQPRLFARQGAARRRLSINMILATALCSLGAGLAMFVLSPLLPIIFGHGYEDAAHFGRSLALLPLAFGLRFVLGSLLVAEGHPALRAILEAVGCVAMVMSAAILIPRFGAAGMTSMILIAETTVAAAAAIALALIHRSYVSSQPAGPSEPQG